MANLSVVVSIKELQLCDLQLDRVLCVCVRQREIEIERERESRCSIGEGTTVRIPGENPC
jgi:hypothetical protein